MRLKLWLWNKKVSHKSHDENCAKAISFTWFCSLVDLFLVLLVSLRKLYADANDSITPQGFFMWRQMKPILQVIVLATAMLVSTIHSFVWKTQQNVQERFCRLYYNTKLQPSNKNINTHFSETWHFILNESKKITRFVVFLRTALGAE